MLFLKQLLDHILTMEVFCTTNLITLLFLKKLNLFNTKKLLQLLFQLKEPHKKKHLKELGLESLKSRGWLRRLCCMYKIMNIGIPKYLTDLIPKRKIGYNIRNRNKSFFNCRTESFKN